MLLAAVELGSPAPSRSPRVAASPSGPSGTARPSPTQSAAASPSGSPSPADIAAELEAAVEVITEQVVEIRGLERRGEVETRILTSAEFRTRVEADFREQNSADYIEASNLLYRRLGLMPEDEDLEDLTLELLEASVIGVYFPDEREMAVVGDVTRIGPLERFTLAHEIDHALQDQHFDLNETLGVDEAATESDRTIARQALIEGDATQLMLEWAFAHLSPSEMGEIAGAGLDPDQQQVLERMPPILQRQLGFPYVEGASFIGALQGGGGWPAVDEAFGDPPNSTEQILHVDAYFARDEPVDVRLPDLGNALGTGWERTLEDTFGEMQMQVFLQGVAPIGDANTAAAGWGGDRLETWEGPGNQWVIAWQTAWDSPADAREFVSAASRAIDTLEDPLTIVSDEGSDAAVFILASDSLLLDRVAALFDSI